MTSSHDVPARGSLAPAVTRAAAVLDLLAAEPLRPVGPSELGRRLGVAKSSISNICAAMVAAGLLRQVDGGYRLGQRLVQYGEAYLAGVDLVREFHEACHGLGEDVDETVQLAVLDGLEVIYLARRDGRQPLRLASEIGRRLPATCTATGKAMLAGLDPGELERRLATVHRLPRLTAHSVATRTALREQLAAVRERGYAVDDQEAVEGLRCLAMPVATGGRAEPAAVSFTLLQARWTAEREQRLLGTLRELTASVAQRLGTLAPRTG
ncbi:MAG: IclR family transcriptional regulator [Actinomycetes bacterium]